MLLLLYYIIIFYLIIIIVIIIIIFILIGRLISMSDYRQWGREFDSRHFYNLKSELGMDRRVPSLVRTIWLLFDWEVADLIKELNIIRLDGA